MRVTTETAPTGRGSKKRLLGLLAGLLALCSISLPSLQGRARALQAPITFVGVALNTKTREADKKLYTYLERKVDLRFRQQEFEYGTAIRRLVEWQEKEGPYLARMTPYAYVAAEMLGAKFEILATYVSKATGSTTYHAYFVVNRSRFDSDMNQVGVQAKPTLDDLLSYIRQTKRAFVYPDKFSTSGYFLPSLYFHNQRIFATTQADENLTAIRVEKVPDTDSLVNRVADGSADLAAVWDGTKAEFQPEGKFAAYKDDVYFIPLPSPLPNDLLVCSAWLDAGTKENIRKAIRDMKDSDQINVGDFITWQDFRDAADAREALATLRREAAQRPAPVTVDIQASDPEYLKAAQQAVRLSGTEFVLYDGDFHKHPDVIWTLESIHDQAIQLTTDILGSNLDPQKFQISFTDIEDLTKRIGAHIHSRMHRIRYVWPYEDEYPAVIRDVDFPIRREVMLKVQKITWLDPNRNLFREGDFFDAEVEDSDFYQFRLNAAGFPKVPGENKLDFDPMSNISYRVILVRPPQGSWLFQVLTYSFLGLLGLAAIGVIVDLRRKQKQPPAPVDEKLFQRTCQEIQEKYHQRWRNRRIGEVNVRWCDRSRIEEYFKDLEAAGLKPDVIIRQQETRGFSIRIPILKDLIGIDVGKSETRERVVDPSGQGNEARLGDLIRFLIREGQLSPFIGRSIEWEALNAIAYDFLGTFSNDVASSDVGGDGLLRRDHPTLLKLVSNHFDQVLEESFHKANFFSQTWEIEENQRGYLLTHRQDLSGTVQIETREEPLSGLILEFDVPREADLGDAVDTKRIDAWLLGKIARSSCRTSEGIRYLCLHFRTIALLQTNKIFPSAGDSFEQKVSGKFRQLVRQSR